MLYDTSFLLCMAVYEKASCRASFIKYWLCKKAIELILKVIYSDGLICHCMIKTTGEYGKLGDFISFCTYISPLI